MATSGAMRGEIKPVLPVLEGERARPWTAWVRTRAVVGISSFTALVFADNELMLKQRRGFASNGADLHGKRLTQFGLVTVQPACLQLVAGVGTAGPGLLTLGAMTAAWRLDGSAGPLVTGI